jgi:hypothetical protein
MAKIFQDAKDVHVVATYVYKKTSETKAYKDSEFKEQFTTSELKETFLKGAIVILDDGGIVKPIKYAESSNVGSIYYIAPNGTTATSADIASLVAVADPV